MTYSDNMLTRPRVHTAVVHERGLGDVPKGSFLQTVIFFHDAENCVWISCRNKRHVTSFPTESTSANRIQWGKSVSRYAGNYPQKRQKPKDFFCCKAADFSIQKISQLQCCHTVVFVWHFQDGNLCCTVMFDWCCRRGMFCCTVA